MSVSTNTIGWCLVTSPTAANPDQPITGHWENGRGEPVTPKYGDLIDPELCQKYWKEALKTLGMAADTIVGGEVLLRVVPLSSSKRQPIKIRGYK